MSEKTPTIEEMDIAIADFMGYYHEGMEPDYSPYACSTFVADAKYHTSWDWLMPVVEKIEKEFCNDFELIIYSSSCYINKWNHEKERYDTFISGAGKKLDAVYAAVYQFITWLNQQKQNNDTENNAG